MKGIAIAQKCGHLLTWPSRRSGDQWADVILLSDGRCGFCNSDYDSHHSLDQREAWKVERPSSSQRNKWSQQAK